MLLLDEPFGALDAKVRKELRDWLRRLHDEVHVTTVFVTHDQEEALEVSDEIVVINHGRIEQVGSPDDLYDKPANDFVMELPRPGDPARRSPGPSARHRDLHHRTAEERSGEVTRLQRIGFEVRAELRTGSERAVGSAHPRPGRRRWGWPWETKPGCARHARRRRSRRPRPFRRWRPRSLDGLCPPTHGPVHGLNRPALRLSGRSVGRS